MRAGRALVLALAVSVVSVPAYAAASQFVFPGLVEEVVEGHTVFASIEKARFTNVTIEAAAVGVLVREQSVATELVKGVLWFNDQFLTSPSHNGKENTRYPCGGAVLAVNAGDPDPRTMLVSYDGTDQLTEAFNSPTDPYDALAQEDGEYEDPDPGVYAQSGDYTLLGLYHDREYDSGVAIDDAGAPGAATPGAFQPRTNAWLDYHEDDDADPKTGDRVTSSLVTGVLAYVESYLVTDPNDRTWVVDKYDGVSTVAIEPGNPGAIAIATSRFPTWVVNVLGKPVFVPDDGVASCPPFVDDPWQQSRLAQVFVHADERACSFTTTQPTLSPVLPDVCPSDAPGAFGGDANGDGLPIDGLDLKPPAIGYYEPTDPATNGGASYCYDGKAPIGLNAGRPPGSGCLHYPDPHTPFDPWNRLRLYNSVLYFYLGPGDVYITHAEAHAADDTNACEETASYNGLYGPVAKAPTEWLCPGGDEHKEGNSHPFNPPGLYVPTAFDPLTGAPIAGTGEWYDVWSANRECSMGFDAYPLLPLELDTPPKSSCDASEHVVHNRGVIDLYYSPTARPMEPPARVFAVLDYEGRTDEFHENNGDPGTAPSPHHPGTPDFDPLPSSYLSES